MIVNTSSRDGIECHMENPQTRHVAGNRAQAEASLARNESGAILVIGVFMAVVLVGLLYYVSGMGTTIFHRERMQDAADAVALATAIGHARGMNLIVFINLVMAALVAVVLALKVIEMLLTGLALILAAIAWFFPPAGAAIPVVNSARQAVAQVHDAAREIVDALLKVLHLTEQAIMYITPAVSVAAGAATATDAYDDVVDLAIAIPPRITLPVENDSYDRLCQEAERMLSDLIKMATDPIPLIGKVISAALDGIIGAVSAAYCYKDGSKPDGYEIDFDRTLPTSATGRQCEQDNANMDPESAACQQWNQEVTERRPGDDGDCDNAACESNVQAARSICAPSAKPAARNYSWTEADVVEEVVYDPVLGNWRTTAFDYSNPTVTGPTSSTPTEPIPASIPEASNAKPCDQGDLYRYRNTWEIEPSEELRARTWSDWNTVAEYTGTPAHTIPVCSMRLRATLDTLPPIPQDPRNPPEGFNAGPYTLRYRAVKHVYGCTEPASQMMEFPDEWSQAASGDGSDMSPHKVEEGVDLGTGDFQMRGFAINPDGNKLPGLARRQLNVAAFNRETEPEGWVSAARIAGRVAVAQAEYFFDHDGTEARDLWMWEMKWKARLVRFTLPGEDDQDEGSSQESSAISGLGFAPPITDVSSVTGDLPGGSPGLDSIADLIVH
jgi:hypothetical protein